MNPMDLGGAAAITVRFDRAQYAYAAELLIAATVVDTVECREGVHDSDDMVERLRGLIERHGIAAPDPERWDEVIVAVVMAKDGWLVNALLGVTE